MSSPPPLSEADLRETLENLAAPEPERTAIALRVLANYPTGDPRLLSAIESHLDDRRACLVGIPYRFGEIRWLAAHALAAERRAQGLRLPVRIEAVAPLDTAGLAGAAEAAGMPGGAGLQGQLETFERLNAVGALPLAALDL